MQSVPLVERHVGTKHNSSLPGSDPPDVVPDQLGEPDLLATTGCDAERQASARGNRELGDNTAGGDPPDLIPMVGRASWGASGKSPDAARSVTASAHRRS